MIIFVMIAVVDYKNQITKNKRENPFYLDEREVCFVD